MKIEIDTELQTIILKNNCNLNELFKLFNIDFDDYSIIPEKETNPFNNILGNNNGYTYTDNDCHGYKIGDLLRK